MKSLPLDQHYPKELLTILSSFTYAPNLRHLRFSHITHLRTSVLREGDGPRRPIIKVLRLCTNLEELIERSVRRLEPDPIFPPTLQKLLPRLSRFFACSGSQLQTLDILHNGGLHGPIGSTVLIPSPALQIRSLSDNDKDPSRRDFYRKGRDELLVKIIDRRWRDSGLSRVRIRYNEAGITSSVGTKTASRNLSCIDHLKSLKVEGLDISILVKGNTKIPYDLLEDSA
ncbi:uncharacterized protein BT62DRAFT_999727 [Guyanagaster necrorhizus]|uniref:Uncharacterized protein n=1 Tax=Guyanagaster necrorhizus TaxID=856835 RepID=A0A9P7W3I6_9AGAR|nr:uncharacterized protein BT62DRAFT_999727 [Guyanagaster necrorhizus MCA 3950]KAG7451978.1 hypothetical protein BT62DRAFT_999727 [Guyanagaster necrorhizus MCA 3950]